MTRWGEVWHGGVRCGSVGWSKVTRWGGVNCGTVVWGEMWHGGMLRGVALGKLEMRWRSVD